MSSSSLSVDSFPVRKAEVRWRAVAGEYLLVHAGLKQYHVLNHVAARIWELADGALSVAAIAERVAADYRHDRAQVLHDVVETIDGLHALQLLDIPDTRPGA